MDLKKIKHVVIGHLVDIGMDANLVHEAITDGFVGEYLKESAKIKAGYKAAKAIAGKASTAAKSTLKSAMTKLRSAKDAMKKDMANYRKEIKVLKDKAKFARKVAMQKGLSKAERARLTKTYLKKVAQIQGRRTKAIASHKKKIAAAAAGVIVIKKRNSKKK